MIESTAIVSPEASIGKNVSIGHYSVIGPNVHIGDGCEIGPHVVIKGPTVIGKNNRFFQFSSIGEEPQDKKYDGEPTRLEIGDNNIFREYVTISRGTVQGGDLTSIGSNNLLMAYVHIAHDCHVASHTVFSNNASLAGHVNVGSYANLGGFVGVHQFCNVGDYAFCAGGSIIVKDVLPFTMVSGHPAAAFGLNVEGLKRRQFTSETITQLKRAYKTLFRQGLTLEQAMEQLASTARECVDVNTMLSFIKHSKRGVVR